MQVFQSKKDNSDTESASNKLQQQIEEKMLDLFEKVIEDRGKYFDEHKDKVPTPNSVSAIANSYANGNAAISGGASLVPGPWGMLAVVPEIVLIIRNQISMVYDIGVAYGHRKKIDPQLLASVFGYALGTGTLGLLVIHSQKILVKRGSLRIMQKLVQLMAGRVTQRLLKSMVGKWIPLAGAVALAAWSKISTHMIAGKAVSVFEKEIEISDGAEDGDEIITVSDSDSEAIEDLKEDNFDELKIQALINLMRIDGSIEDEEMEFIAQIIEDANIDDQNKLDLIEQMNQGSKFKIDYSKIADSPSDATDLIVELVSLAKRDGDFHISEKIYIKQVGKMIGIDGSDLEEVMAVG